ncbi:MAG TPA: pyridoxamine 5'-phosphate oxidase family protein [Frankiaceae bacterium]|nr:pyridoxamine 5'-phosphate oxidase family protein [Frankiaceae bacterium]
MTRRLPGLPSVPEVGRLLQAWAWPRGGAIANVRQAVGELARTAGERRALVPAAGVAGPTDPEPPGAPGAPAEPVLRALTAAQCLDLLATQQVGRVAFVANEAHPTILPVNYVLDGDRIVIRSGPGPKLDAADRGDVVAFEVDQLDPAGRTGWSVVAVGAARRLRTVGEQARAAALPLRPWAPGPRSYFIQITPGRLTGRLLAAPPT